MTFFWTEGTFLLPQMPQLILLPMVMIRTKQKMVGQEDVPVTYNLNGSCISLFWSIIQQESIPLRTLTYRRLFVL